jgi:hypothetical protein
MAGGPGRALGRQCRSTLPRRGDAGTRVATPAWKTGASSGRPRCWACYHSSFARRRRGDHHPEPAGKMNAFNATMWDELLDVCREIGASEIDRCVVISGGWGLLLQYRSRCHRRGRAAPSVGRNATREPRRRRIAPVAAADDLQGHRCGGRRRGESGLWLRPRGGVGGRPKFRGR